MNHLKIYLAAGALLLAACDQPAPDDHGGPPITGVELDAIQRLVRERLDRDFAGAHAEHVRLERSADGRRAVVHASLAATFDEDEYQRICRAISETADSVLVDGQSLELHLLHGEDVVHSCGL